MSNLEVFDNGLVEKNGVMMMGSKAICSLLNSTREEGQNELLHKHILRDIRDMFSNLDIDITRSPNLDYGVFISYFQHGPSRGDIEEYFLNQDYALCLVGGKRAKVRLAMAKAFNRMKTAEQTFVLPDFTNPAIAARAWADAVEKKMQAEQTAQLALMEASTAKATVASFEKDHSWVSLSSACKSLGYRPMKTMAYMREKGFMTRLNQPSSELCGRGFFEVCSVQVSETRWEQITRVTGKGMIWMKDVLSRGLPFECYECNKDEAQARRKAANRKKDCDVTYEDRSGNTLVLM